MADLEGTIAPDFTLKDQNNNSVTLSAFRGKTVVLYFYPRDNTPGCTQEAIGFRELHDRFKKLDVEILGVSPDNAASHAKFCEKQKLSFTLLSDSDNKVMSEYGAFGEKILYGKKMIGVIRSTVLIDKEGKIFKQWKKVPKAADHPAKVLEVIEQNMSS
jgi:peroxiredoxin Q/BCP